MEVPLLIEADATAVKHEEDCLMQDSALLRRDQAAEGGGRDNTPSSPTAAGPQEPIGARTTGRKRKRPDQCVASSMAGSCTKKTTTMSAAQVVFCNALFDGVVVVEFEDAVAGSMESLDFEDAVAGSCAKKTTARSATAKEKRYHEIAEDGTTTTTTNVLWPTSKLQMEMRSATTRICWKCGFCLRLRLSEV
ncbi:hypothetical protein B296_00029749 [Ensete ventricosum]|uniref:Uncharacterized protein n=1 Tax=Ensete ventricosum TaxID=4639 RepID=A0A426XVX5_ENSVE|nr:hypothetical protein B296_00029749 [Ensete ventricosum]